LAFDVAEKELDIPKMLDAEGIISCHDVTAGYNMY
jgi:hypothetical protein